MKRILLLAWLLLTSSLAFADCEDPRVSNFYKQFLKKDISTQEQAMNLIACKRHPSINATIFVLGNRSEVMDKDGFNNIDFNLLVVDDIQQKIVAKTTLTNFARDEETNPILSVVIDTARYNLSKHDRAFGIVLDYVGASHANPTELQKLSLFVIDQNNIKMVLHDIEVKNSSGEWDTDCAGKYTDIQSTLKMSSEQSNGYFNILLKKTIIKTKTKKVQNDCETVYSHTAKKNYLMRFNGQMYATYVIN